MTDALVKKIGTWQPSKGDRVRLVRTIACLAPLGSKGEITMVWEATNTNGISRPAEFCVERLGAGLAYISYLIVPMGDFSRSPPVCPFMSTTPSATAQYLIPLARKAALEATLTKLSKRGERRGLPALTWSWGKADASDPARVVVPMTFTGERPRFNGWSFVATLQHLDGENILRTVPGCVVHDDCRAVAALGRACAGSDLPAIYKTRGPVCDHCEAKRRRRDTYVLVHAATNKHVQVGSTCIADFLGGGDLADKAAAHAEMWGLAASAAEGAAASGSGSEWDSGNVGETPLGDFLAAVVFAVRSYGWTSRKDTRTQNTRATADVAYTFLFSAVAREAAAFEVTTEDAALATAAETWAESITDAAVDADSARGGDYLHNLRAVARTGLVGHRTIGIAANMVVAYQRTVARETRAAERTSRPVANVHLGTVGAKVAFGAAPKKGVDVVRPEAVTLDFVTGFETQYGYTTVLKFKTADGATVVWKASSTMLDRSAVGRRFALVGTVKAHDEYKGEKQTVLTRCAVTEVAA